MWKTIDVTGCACDDIHVELVDVPSGASLPDVASCSVCGQEARRKLSASIAKLETQERVHGGELVGGKLVRKLTGHKQVKEQAQLRRKLTKAKRAKDATTAQEVQKEMKAKAAEAQKQL